jgi:hypothetical protein
MPDASGRIYGPAQPGTGNTTLYTVPSATTVVVRNIHICNTTATAATISLAINASAATAANCWLTALSVPGNSSYDWSGFLHLSTTDTLQALQGTASALTVTISGVITT